MEQALEVRVDGREIYGRPADMTQPWGLFVQKDGFQGWGGLSAARREALARAVQHGEHDVAVYLPSRVVTVDGWAIAPSPRDLLDLLEEAASTAGTGSREHFQVTQWGAERWAHGRRILATADDAGRWQGRYLYAPFQMQFVFPDPRKYDETRVFPAAGTAGAVNVSHRGTFPAFPEIEIPSAPAAYSISSPGGTFVVTGATAGGTHTVELRTGRVYRDGIEMPGVGRGDLWAVPGGSIWLHTMSVPGRARITDTYI